MPTKKTKNRNAVNTYADRKFSLRIRERDGRCRAAEWGDGVVCGGELQCAHIIACRYSQTRHDEENAIALCLLHHDWYTGHPNYWRAMIEEQHPGLWDELRMRAGLKPREITKDLKTCNACGLEKPIEEFWVTNGIKVNNTCVECGHTYRTPEKNREGWLRRQYGITVEKYEELLTRGGGGCWVCGRPPGKKRLSVDHDHKTGRVRGILCWFCNSGLQRYHDDPKLLRRAADYLEGSLNLRERVVSVV